MASVESLRLAAEASALLQERKVRVLLIGAVALAAHGYVRGTEDVDLAIAVPPPELAKLADVLRARLPRSTVELSESTPDDPLGGVVNVNGHHGELVQIVNFDNAPGGGFPALVQQARSSAFLYPGDISGELVSVEDLILFKLYAGGTKSRADVEELLARCSVDTTRLRERARSYRMSDEVARILGD